MNKETLFVMQLAAVAGALVCEIMASLGVFADVADTLHVFEGDVTVMTFPDFIFPTTDVDANSLPPTDIGPLPTSS